MRAVGEGSVYALGESDLELLRTVGALLPDGPIICISCDCGSGGDSRSPRSESSRVS